MPCVVVTFSIKLLSIRSIGFRMVYFFVGLTEALLFLGLTLNHLAILLVNSLRR